MVDDNTTIINSGIITSEDFGDISTYSILKSGSFRGSSGAPESAKPGQFRMVMYWEQTSITGSTTKTKLSATMWFYHKWEWYSSVLANGKTYLKIGTDKKTLAATANVGGAGGEYLVMGHSIEIPSSTTSITIYGRCDIGSSYDLPTWYGVEGASTISLGSSTTPVTPPPVAKPGAPTSISVSGKYEPGQKVSVSWSGATGTVSNYEVEYDQYLPGVGWKSWYSAGTSTTTSLSHSIVSVGAQKLRYRVRSKNSSGTSDWLECSTHIYHYGVKINSGGLTFGVIKVWTGSSWSPGIIKVWNGSSWVYSFNS